MAMNITGDPAADAELERNPFSLLTAMLLDQQVPMEKAFSGPRVLVERLGAPLDPEAVAGHDPDEFAALCARPPAVHRFPAAMAGRIQALARHVVEEYAGDTSRIWSAATPGRELTANEVLGRLRRLPGFGAAKATIFLALLGKQAGVRPEGWLEATGRYGEPGVFRSVADVVDADSLARVRATKREQKLAAKTAAKAPAKAPARSRVKSATTTPVKSTSKSPSKSAAKTPAKSAARGTAKTAGTPAGKSAGKTAGKAAGKPAGKTAGKAAGKSGAKSQPATQPNTRRKARPRLSG